MLKEVGSSCHQSAAWEDVLVEPGRAVTVSYTQCNDRIYISDGHTHHLCSNRLPSARAWSRPRCGGSVGCSVIQ